MFLANELEIIKNIPNTVLFINKQGDVIFANDRAYNTLGVELEKNKNIFDIIKNKSLKKVFDKCMLSKEIESTRIEWKQPYNETSVFFKVSVKFINDFKKSEAFILSLTDVTAIHTADKMRVNFIANASHELKTPLTSILGFIETINTVAKNDEKSKEKFLQIMALEANRMKDILDDLLSLSKIESLEHQIPVKKVNIVKILKDAISSVSMNLNEKKIAINKNFNIKQKIIIKADSMGIYQVFSNLINNAIKYGDSNNIIDVNLTSKENFIYVEIKDKGFGIAKKNINRITERFFRVDKARSRNMGGTGLGLAIVKHIVIKHGGELSIKSKLNYGSSFIVKFPVE